MKPGFLDSTSGLDSPIHRLEARAKIIAVLAAVVICVSTPPTAYAAFGAYFALAASLLALSRLPAGFVLRRLLMIVPFVLLVAAFLPFLKTDAVGGGYSLGLGGLAVSRGGLLVFWNTAAKASFGILMIVLLSGTTPFPQLLQGLRRLRCPDVVVMILSFTYRYLFVLTDEVLRLKIARDARGYRGRWLWQARTIGQMIAVFFLRSYARAERIYLAMISRGYDGRYAYLPAARLGGRDTVFAAAVIGLMLTARLALKG